MRENLQQIKELCLLVPPKGRKERLIFLFSFIFYILIGLAFLFQTSLIDSVERMHDLYFNLDNPYYFQYGGISNSEAHPLFVYFLKPITLLGNLLEMLHYKAKGVFLITFYCSLICLGNVYVYRYLKDFTKLQDKYAFLLTIFYASFTTNIVLSFTPESFTVVSWLSMLMAYYFTLMVKNNRKVLFGTFLVTSIVVAGVTITNYAKNAIYYLFTPKSWKLKTVHVVGVGLLMLIVMVIVVECGDVGFMGRMRWRLNYTDVNAYNESYFYVVANYFLGAPILLTSVVVGQYHNGMHVLVNGIYTEVWQYLWWTLLYGVIVFYALILNRENKLCLMLLAVWGVDLFLHVILRYDLQEGIIFGGHWVYVIPLFLGWLFFQLTEKKKKILFYVLVGMFVVMFVNNMTLIYDLYKYGTELFPPVDVSRLNEIREVL